jgi:hypothetical protein
MHDVISGTTWCRWALNEWDCRLPLSIVVSMLLAGSESEQVGNLRIIFFNNLYTHKPESKAKTKPKPESEPTMVR